MALLESPAALDNAGEGFPFVWGYAWRPAWLSGAVCFGGDGGLPLPGIQGLGGHEVVELAFGPFADEWDQAGAVAQQAAACVGIGDVAQLLVGDVHMLSLSVF